MLRKQHNREKNMWKQPSQKFLKKAYLAGGLFRDSKRIYQAEYSQAQKRYWFFPIVYHTLPRIKGFQIMDKSEYGDK